MRRILIVVCALILGGGAAGWFVSAPDRLGAETIPERSADLDNGRTMFFAGGCAACHAAPEASGDARLVMTGGRKFETEFGTFVAPNISPHPDAGIGGWSDLDFVNAMLRGTSPDGAHYYPAFPYASYARMPVADVLDLWAFMKTLPQSDATSAPHDLAFPFTIRRGIGLWKRLHLGTDATPIVALSAPTPQLERGQYLVEGPGHCGECHTPRDATAGLDPGRWLGGAPNPEGRGRIPNITPGGKTISEWSEGDIAEYLSSGFTPDYDTAGGSMVEVVKNTENLSDDDRAAIAAYLKAIPVVPEAPR